MGRFVDLTGQRFGRLKIVKRVGSNNQKRALWECACGCGNVCVVCSLELRAGDTKSCGCLKKELISNLNKGKKLPTEVREKIRQAHLGKTLSKEHKKSISDANVGRNFKVGEKNPNWNPNINEVYLNKVTKNIVSSLIRYTLRSTGGIKTTKSEIMLGYTKEQFKNHLESKFLPGMSWDNHGNGEGHWHIDHVKPISAFVKEGITDPKIINALSNLQPLWAEDNLRKGNKWNG